MLDEGANLFLPNLSIDIAVIGFEAGALKVLLLELDGKWMLPGGYIFKNSMSLHVMINFRPFGHFGNLFVEIFQESPDGPLLR